MSEALASRPDPATDAPDVAPSLAEWADTTVIEFASSGAGEPIFYAIDHPRLRGGSIVAIPKDEREPVWLADSLALWLANLAACDGVELAFAPDEAARLDPRVIDWRIREFRKRNPRSRIFPNPDASQAPTPPGVAPPSP
jgi:hypothetical protein